jgi:GNAT superfamily N-acetyltransferase
MTGPQPPACDIHQGYRPGLIGRITEMHALYYARAAGFGLPFEVVVSGGLTEFAGRLDRPMNALWSAVAGDRVLGSIAIDGEDLGGGLAHLRWFIVDDALRGNGAGKRLLRAALDFVDARGFQACHLWTFAGLAAARHLYESHGFVLAEERPGRQWGSEVLEQRFVRSRPP